MKMTDWFQAELEAEAVRTRGALERVPEGKDDWKPHDKSMPLAQLARLVAMMPMWLGMIVGMDELDIGGPRPGQPPSLTVAELLKSLDENVAKGREALANTSEDHLQKPWRLLVSGKVVSEQPRYVVIRDTFLHLAHHRGQLTVYLRLNNIPVPAIYGPSADDSRFA
jgi:uncharacterized damage-inducible protein DinB